jgi:hypothetical protein
MLYDETASPTARMTSIKILLQLAASRSYHYRSVDIAGAYLHSDIDKEIYVSVPDPSNIERRLKARLRKSLYGLKQAGKLWYDNLTTALASFGATSCLSDRCVFAYNDPITGEHMYIAVHVDDLLIVSTSSHLISRLVDHLTAKYGEVSNTDASTHLGLQIARDEDGNIKMTQPGLAAKLLEELGLDFDSRTEATPMTDGYLHELKEAHRYELACPRQFARIVGMLIYLCHSRPDLLYACSVLSTRSNAPTDLDLKAAQRVGRYLLGTLDLGITFRADSPVEIHGYADASFAGHPDGRSHSGNLVHLARGSAPVAAASKKQSIVALSSTEAELESLKSEATLTSWVLALMEELGYEQAEPVVIHEDNQAAISLCSSSGNWGRTRHFVVRYNYVKSKIEDHTMELVYTPTDEQLADILTKPLAAPVFIPLRRKLLG